MLRDLTRGDWLSILDLPPSRVPEVLILRGTRNLKSQYQAILPYFADPLHVGTPNGIFEDVLIGEVGGRSVGFACVYGAAMASEIVHAFGVLGTKAVIQTGNCGALGDGFEAGDILLADRAFCGEGAAQYYKPDSKWVDASRSLLEKAAARFGPGGCRVGSIYTTGALLAEGMEDLDRWHREGFAAVDLETAATYAVAEYFGMDRLSILYAFDNPRRKEHILLTDSEKDVRRGEANARVRDMVLALAAESGLQY